MSDFLIYPRGRQYETRESRILPDAETYMQAVSLTLYGVGSHWITASASLQYVEFAKLRHGDGTKASPLGVIECELVDPKMTATTTWQHDDGPEAFHALSCAMSLMLGEVVGKTRERFPEWADLVLRNFDEAGR